MIEIVDSELNQWDTGRFVAVKGIDASHLHFANAGDSKAVIMQIPGAVTAIPNFLLQTGKQLCVYAVENGITVESAVFPVRKRPRPENYVYEDDQRNYIYELIQSVEEATAEAERVAEELRTAKENGEFNGDTGPQGEKGDPGIVNIDDTKVGADAWSSKNTVDKLCPTFTESGSIVTCEPVEGYPLEVTAEEGATITRCGKNLLTTSRVENPASNSNKTIFSGSLKAPFTISCDFSQATLGGSSGAGFLAATIDGADQNLSWTMLKSGWTKTTGTLTKVRLVNWCNVTGVVKMQLEVGSVATSYEPYKKTETFPVGENVPALPGVNTLWADKGDITVTGKTDLESIIEKLPNGGTGDSADAVLYTKQTLTEAQKAQARANIGAVDNAYVDKAIADATSGVDLSEYELKGNTPQYLAGADARYNIVLDIKEETAVSIVSDTVAEMAGGTNVKFGSCEETNDNGVFTLTCNKASPWYQIKKTFTMHGLVTGESYNIMLDAVASDRSGTPIYLLLLDSNSKTVVDRVFSAAPGIRTLTFTATEPDITVCLYPVSSSNTPAVGMYFQYRDIWINKADAREVRTDIYNFATTTSEQLDLRDICGGVTVTATPAANVYTQVIEGDIPNGPLAGKTCVCFGDSITGNYVSPFDYPSIIAQKTGMNVINGGFGGCRMAQHPDSSYTAFSMYNLADSIAAGDWSVQDAAVGTVGSANAAEHLASLKEVDWAAVDFITIFYGTNDFMGGVAIGEDDGSQSTSQFKGALRHSIETILTAYPKIRIVLITPIYRFWENGGVVTDSDTYEVSGAKLTDFVDAVISVADEYKVPAFNLYNSLGINKINRMTFLADGVHPSEAGRERIGESIAARLSAI